MNRRLVELFFDAGVRAHNDFDRLPRRYRAVAAWREAGELRSTRRAGAGVDVPAPLVLDGYARVRLRVYGTGADWDALSGREAWLAGAEAGVVWPSVLGVIEAGLAAGAGGRLRLNVGLAAPVR